LPGGYSWATNGTNLILMDPSGNPIAYFSSSGGNTLFEGTIQTTEPGSQIL
jgi:hypothetical protein